MKKKIVFKKLAHYYDLVYAWKGYQQEADKIKSLITKYKESDGRDLLEIACGTGKHTACLKDSFSILATDNSQAMLSIAKKMFPKSNLSKLI